MKTIIIFCAHSDDEAVGMGGTIYKLLNEYKIIKIVFSYGELSHPHLQKKVTAKKRVEETKKLSNKLGIETLFLGLSDSKLQKEVESKNIKEKIKDLIIKYKPCKIYMPTETDLHKDHRIVNKTVKKAIKEIKYNTELYSFEVWNVANENQPRLYVDITPYWKRKINMIKEFKSQHHFLYPLLIPVFLRSIYYGKKINVKYAEKFYKLK